MAQIPFNVSARTALLIGRENIANSKGAIIELVKNCYDADSDFSIIVIDTIYEQAPLSLSEFEIDTLKSSHSLDIEAIKPFYEKSSDKYELKNNLDKSLLDQINSIFLNLNSIYIIDNGEGMNHDIIQNNWMTIGTDNKLETDTTRKERIKSGAKGIGRFALDKLGKKCELLSLAHSSLNGNNTNCVYWSVDWSKFEEKNTTINEVNATIETFSNTNI